MPKLPQNKSKHDAFFGRSLEHLPIAKAFFRAHIPAHLQPLIDFGTWVRVDRTNTDAKLKRRHRDIVHKARIGIKHTVVVCTEHQSGEDWKMPVRFLRYN